MKKSKKKITQILLKFAKNFFHIKIYGYILYLRSLRKFKKEINKSKSFIKYSENLDEINKYEYKITSQNNEDGILEYIFSKIPNNKYFVEIGFDLYEFNSLNLIKKGWNGKLIEQNLDECLALDMLLKKFFPFSNTEVVNQSITLENTNLIFSLDEGKKEIDFFSLDIDGNDYWILKDLDLSNVKVICCEYNHFLNKNEKKTIPYNKNFNFENECFFGASLLAFNDLLLSKNFKLIAIDSSGVNAFFVHKRYEKFFSILSPIDSHRSVGRFYSREKYQKLLNKTKELNFIDIK